MGRTPDGEAAKKAMHRRMAFSSIVEDNIVFLV